MYTTSYTTSPKIATSHLLNIVSCTQHASPPRHIDAYLRMHSHYQCDIQPLTRGICSRESRSSESLRLYSCLLTTCCTVWEQEILTSRSFIEITIYRYLSTCSSIWKQQDSRAWSERQHDIGGGDRTLDLERVKLTS